jgi:hypothetical protein
MFPIYLIEIPISPSSFSVLSSKELMSYLFLKPKVPAFTVPQLTEAMDVILERAKELMVIIFLNPNYYKLPPE